MIYKRRARTCLQLCNYCLKRKQESYFTYIFYSHPERNVNIKGTPRQENVEEIPNTTPKYTKVKGR